MEIEQKNRCESHFEEKLEGQIAVQNSAGLWEGFLCRECQKSQMTGVFKLSEKHTLLNATQLHYKHISQVISLGTDPKC